ncbi:MAG: single-stranded-DNA-specific exonuclease RecJ [Gammaproteobacteria bacterium]|nr:MAG: single-stranded-DNA-specific exonuclease RecJ [Gammaproteobacteria bacterium]
MAGKISIQRRILDVSVDDLPQEMHPVLKRVYQARKVSGEGALDRSLERLHNPDSLLGIKEAAQLLAETIMNDRRILIVADFDADGATSCALAVRALKAMGAAHVHYLVPDRAIHGYGLTPAIVEEAVCHSPDLIVTVDNGISSIVGVDTARARGIKVLVTDHHLPGNELPAADAIVNPNQPGDTSHCKALAGVGVTFYVLLALRKYLREQNWFEQQSIAEPSLAQWLDLVALGTVADLVPLDENNRRLVAQGLARINHGHCVAGIRALLVEGKRENRTLVSNDLGFFVAPRINAAGRLDDMSVGIECLLTDDAEVARKLAARLDEINHERREIQLAMQQQALAVVEQLDLQASALPTGLCLFDERWHQGVVGLVASRLKERYHRPVIAMAPAGDGELKGSARSISGFHIRDTLDQLATQYPQLLQKFGGHAMAAGLSIRQDDFDAFAAAFDELAAQQLDESDLQEILLSDGELEADELHLSLAETFRDAGPWGQGFPEPLFEGTFKVVSSRIVGGKHVKMVLSHEGGVKVDAIAFNQLEDKPAHDSQRVRMLYRLDINEFRGAKSVQLIVVYMAAESESGLTLTNDALQEVI